MLVQEAVATVLGKTEITPALTELTVSVERELSQSKTQAPAAMTVRLLAL